LFFSLTAAYTSYQPQDQYVAHNYMEKKRFLNSYSNPEKDTERKRIPG
jgi:hypothetical protein